MNAAHASRSRHHGKDASELDVSGQSATMIGLGPMSSPAAAFPVPSVRNSPVDGSAATQADGCETRTGSSPAALVSSPLGRPARSPQPERLPRVPGELRLIDLSGTGSIVSVTADPSPELRPECRTTYTDRQAVPRRAGLGQHRKRRGSWSSALCRPCRGTVNMVTALGDQAGDAPRGAWMRSAWPSGRGPSWCGCCAVWGWTKGGSSA